MKNNAAIKYLKHVISVLTIMAKSKSTAIKSKTEALKTRLEVLSLLKSKKLSFSGLGTKAISHKIHSLLGHKEEDQESQDHENENNKAIVLYNNAPEASEDSLHCQYNDLNNQEIILLSNGENYDDYDDKYPDLTHSLFDEEDEYLGDPNASAIDMVRNFKEEEGQNFVLEDEIDNVADLFIRKFHKKMRLQKLESFKRYQAMLQRGA
ncbi:uncharacterized protein LOC107769451 [Nicotiana tabacum]|uniref:Uncharacterized protein LOC107769451 n=1 Tax=Nicotiana tabacum TaxID=4097 RepID=A0A1S3XWS0_TOBAC|nr:uncharacterized protein LOC104110324 [Nicotiana tomentosiformis]XP_016444152.1 PREDICTED: uncharacterized protein LOC107769451 [Nicotiana tabacum]